MQTWGEKIILAVDTAGVSSVYTLEERVVEALSRDLTRLKAVAMWYECQG
jgi:hypothetical protein